VEESGSMNPATILRGACALLGDDFAFEPRPLDLLVEGERIKAIAPAGSLAGGEIVDLARFP
jgi:guanine deaminase